MRVRFRSDHPDLPSTHLYFGSGQLQVPDIIGGKDNERVFPSGMRFTNSKQRVIAKCSTKTLFLHVISIPFQFSSIEQRLF